MWAGSARLLGLGLAEHLGQELRPHLRRGNRVHFFEIGDVAQLHVVEGKTVEAIAFAIDIHRTAIRATKIQFLIFPARHLWHGLIAMEQEAFGHVEFIFLDFI